MCHVQGGRHGTIFAFSSLLECIRPRIACFPGIFWT
jgi:hypothetical protein